jgi:hypothetical protein
MGMQQSVMVANMAGVNTFDARRTASMGMPVMQQPDLVASMQGTMGGAACSIVGTIPQQNMMGIVPQSSIVGILPQQGMTMVPGTTGMYAVSAQQQPH